MNVEEHYGMLLGVAAPWTVVSVELALERQRVEIYVEYRERVGNAQEAGKRSRVMIP